MNNLFNKLLESMVPGPEDNITTSTISTAQAQYEEQLALGRSSRASKTKS